MPTVLALTAMIRMIDSWIIAAHQDPAGAMNSYKQLSDSLQAIYKQLSGGAPA
jgi:hypothetical protein